MSDVDSFPVHVALELHTIQHIAFQWSGEEQQATLIAVELGRELRMRDAGLEKANFVLAAHGGASLNLIIHRLSDGRVYRMSLREGDWLDIELHEGRIHEVIKLSPASGGSRFRRSRPVVTLRPRLLAAD